MYLFGNRGKISPLKRGIFISHCDVLPSLSYKRREGSLVKGFPIFGFAQFPFLSV